jgi:microcompartment protein CcmL/EutN
LSNDKQDTNSDDNEVTCNMCGDPKCPRKLGEPHKKCIHYNDLKKK